MLRAVDLATPASIPVLGVNCGQMGYLTGIEPAMLDDALERLAAGIIRDLRTNRARERR